MAKQTKQERIEHLEYMVEVYEKKALAALGRVNKLEEEAGTKQFNATLEDNVKDKTGLSVWLASNDAGEPVCIGGGENDPVSHISTAIYHKNGQVTGVVLSDGYGITVAAHGLIPAEVYMKEVEYLSDHA